MKPKIRTPFFETSVKNYIYGDDVYNFAKAADNAAKKYDVDVLFIAPYTEIRRIAEGTERLVVLAPYMDVIRPGRGMADVLPEALKAAGARGVVLNHCERPMTLSHIKKGIDRANELDMLSFVCADTIAEACAIAELHPNIINPEPSELIGTENASDMSYVKGGRPGGEGDRPGYHGGAGGRDHDRAAKFMILLWQVRRRPDPASGILRSEDPYALLDEMVRSVKQAGEDLIGNKQ